MIPLRRLLSTALVAHGALHLLGMAVALRWVDPDDIPYSTEIIGGVDIGSGGMRALAVAWFLAALAFIASAVAVWQGRPKAVAAIGASAAFSTLVCLAQVDTAWRGLAIDLVILLIVVVARLLRDRERGELEAMP
jgi:hypothetical protein